MLDKDIAAAIIAAVDAGFEAQIRFTQDMVRCPSVRGQEHTVQDLMADAMARRGLSVDHWKVKVDDIKDLPGFAPVVDATYENAYNVVGTYRPAHRHGRSLIFNGHIDVVPTGDWDRWTTPPFEPRIDGKWMYGRGAGDMKSGLAGRCSPSTRFAPPASRPPHRSIFSPSSKRNAPATVRLPACNAATTPTALSCRNRCSQS